MTTPLSEGFKFQDCNGHEWDLKITVGTALTIDRSDYTTVTKMTDWTFLNPNREFLQEIFTNTPFAIALVWTIIQPQVQRLQPLGESATQDELENWFIDQLDGDSLELAKKTLYRSIADFFPGQRTVLSSLISKMERAQKLMEMEYQKADPLLDKLMEEEVQQRMAEARSSLPGLSSQNE